METISLYFVCFLFYSVFGWCFEVSLYLIRDRKFVNRGFLNGSYCPIYGAGAMMILLLFGQITNLLSLFLSSAVVCCTLEYITSYLMEKFFHARWWDYSDLPFNLNGRICLLGAVAFGTLAVLLMTCIHPAVTGLFGKLPPLALEIVALVAAVLFLTDCVATFCVLANLQKRLEKAAEKLYKVADTAKEKWQAAVLKAHEEHLLHHFNWQERRIIMAFPQLKLHRHDEILKAFREISARRRKK